ncbi:tripartite-type tricarboxylate transporter receptor subunit TctC [Stella humosa]|uniref:Tripartite-type tricarboxylate transporter receptor subunit TctC n=1 Tax=Stella humosa TaxID=94 RepID=A0A3N1MA98_9PROT|nr:tripartite tricarboxylate transporter substrate binding protein [Stella humosa]ROP99626.1 tripartite-type tricarboxylate transporter receptor subunit TctC [Stella humosa]BBK31149.1 hypothetical protein STHU_17830 [Stella humosa]
MTGRRAVIAGLLAAPFVRPAAARWEPQRPIRILRGFQPGSTGDAILHRLADALTPLLGRPIVIESRPGAGGNIAMDALARAPADGYTLIFSPVGPVVINPILMGPRLSYDAERDFTPLFHICDQPLAALTHPSLPAAPADMLGWLRQHPDTAFGSPGIGSTHHLLGAMLSRAMGLHLRHVPYRGASAMLTDLVAGQIVLGFDLVGGAAAPVLSGQVQALAVSTAGRSPLLPAVPTFGECGLPQVVASSWLGIFAPAGLPAEIATRLVGAFDAAVGDPAFVAWLGRLGATPAGGDGASFTAFLARERTRWTALIRESGITLD